MRELRQLKLTLALVASALAVGWAAFTFSLVWHPAAPFDIVGVLWLIVNLPNLIAWAFLFGLGALAIYAWILWLRDRA